MRSASIRSNVAEGIVVDGERSVAEMMVVREREVNEGQVELAPVISVAVSVEEAVQVSTQNASARNVEAVPSPLPTPPLSLFQL